MKRFQLVCLMAFVALLPLSSCEKDKDDKVNLIGTTWVGTFDNGSIEYPGFKIEFKSQIDLVVSIEDVNTWQGTWEYMEDGKRVMLRWQESSQEWTGIGVISTNEPPVIEGTFDRSPQYASATFEATRQ